MNKDIEVWKDIPEYQNYYQVSSFGRVKSLERTVKSKPSSKHPDGRTITYKEKVLSPMYDLSGYQFVQLYKQDKFKSKRIHRVVAEVFIPNPNNLPQVNHKDENKENNSIDNLEWCTSKDNVNYGTGKYRKVTNNIPIAQYTLDGQLVAEYSSASQAAAALNIHQARSRDILRVCRGIGKTVKGYTWKFINK